MMFWVFVTAWLTVLSSIWFLRRKRLFSTFDKLGVTGPKPSVFFGNYLELYKKGPIECHTEWTKKYGKVFGYYYGVKPILVVGDPELLKQIQLKDFQSFINRADMFTNRKIDTVPYVHKLTKVKNQKWKEIRSVLTPSFTTGKLKIMVPDMNNAISDFMDKVRTKSTEGKPFNAQEFVQGLTMDAIGRTSLGLHTNVQKNPKDPYLKYLRVHFDANFHSTSIFIDLCFPWLARIAFFFKRLSLWLKSGGNYPGDELHKLCKEVIETRRNDPSKRQADMLQLLIDAEKGSKASGDITPELLTAGGDADNLSIIHDDASLKEPGRKTYHHLMTDEEVQCNAFMMFLAGYETTSTALSFACAVLARHPNVQERVRQEIDELAQKEENLDYTTISKAQYLDQVLLETMRLYPPVYQFTTRKAGNDVNYGMLHIPEGTNILVPVYQLHHDSEFWDDPESFDPDRFSPENRDKITPLTCQPFGAGPRNCIGMRYAQMGTKLTLAKLFTNFRLELANPEEGPIELDMKQVILHPRNGVHVRAVPIK